MLQDFYKPFAARLENVDVEALIGRVDEGLQFLGGKALSNAARPTWNTTTAGPVPPGGSHSWTGIAPSSVAISIRRSGSFSLMASNLPPTSGAFSLR